MTFPGRLPISVILATIEPPPWPDLANCLEVLAPQVAAVGGEIIVGDGHGAALDATGAAGSRGVSWVRIPGASVFELRARAVERARGEIIALTEDHCLVGRDWCEQILNVFARHPNAMGVTGPVLNGSTDRRIDQANFLHSFASCIPPVSKTQCSRCPPPANVAFRRAAIGPGPIPAGHIELELGPQLFGQGLFHVHDGITVTHVQSHGFWLTLRAHFDNGRSTTGLHPVSLTRRQLPWNLLRGSLRAMSPEARATRAVRESLPLMFLLSCCHAAGEVAGIVAGPGRSPARLR
ncbi:MAG TPA: glycosyltransferase family A protein [Gemmatimonadaceae bacterium]|nr:glycosyltransferase family A protein [Gemmatimonadaceae bacterium]